MVLWHAFYDLVLQGRCATGEQGFGGFGVLCHIPRSAPVRP